VAELVLGNVKIVVALKAQPELRRVAKVLGQTQRRVGCNGPLAKDDLVDSPGMDPYAESQAVLADAHGLEELLKENLTGVYGSEFLSGHIAPSWLVVVDDLNLVGITVPPYETDTPTLIVADTVLALPISGELLQAVARRKAEIGEALGVVEHAELAVGQLLDVGGEARRPLAGEDSGGFAAPYRLDHEGNV
jgi:hypothetical protein